MFFLLLVVYYSFLSSAVLGQRTTTGTVRLYRNSVADTNQSWSSGIVQIYYSNSWGNICDDSSFGSDEADVICHQLGYTGASSYSNTGTTKTWGTDTSETKLSQVSCSSSLYLTITQCSFSTNFVCSDSNDVTVSCYTTRIWSSPTTGDIRLTGGSYSNRGLLEVYCNGGWGTVCDDHFSDIQARVTCRQLGYNYYENYDYLSITENYSQPIYLHYLSGCTSSDDCLTECGGCPSSGISSCSHYEDITLQCEYSSFHSKVYSTLSDTCEYTATVSSINSSVLGTIVGSIIVFTCLPAWICVFVVIVRVKIGIRSALRNNISPRTNTTHTVVAHAPSTTVVATNIPQQSTYYPAGPNFCRSTDALPPGYFAQSPAPQQGYAIGYPPVASNCLS